MAEYGVSKETYEEILQLLRDFNNPSKLDSSPRKFSCLVTAHLESSSGSRLEILKDVFTEILRMVEQERADYGEILHGRFWEGLTVEEMLNSGRPWPVEEKRDPRTFLYHQQKAVIAFAFWFLKKEKACEHRRQQRVSDGNLLVSSSITQTNSALEPVIKSRTIVEWLSKNRLLVTILIFSSIFILLLILQRNSYLRFFIEGSIPHANLSTPTILPAQFSELESEIAVTPSTPLDSSLCGEVSQVEVTFQENRFLPNQGVSSFTKENTQGGILSNRIRSLASMPNGLLIGYFDSSENATNGLSFLNWNTKKKFWANCNEGGVTQGKLVNSIAVDLIGRVWVATEGDGILMYDGESWRTYTETRDNSPITLAYEIIIDKDGGVWVATSEGIAKFDGEGWEIVFDAADELKSDPSYTIAFDSKNNIWIGHIFDGVSQFIGSTGEWISHEAGENSIGGNQIRGIVVRKGNGSTSEAVWFATEDGGVSLFENGAWKTLGIQDGLPSAHVRTIAIDTLNRIWIGTDKGVSYFDGENWVRYHSLSTLSIAFTPGCDDQSCPQNDNAWTATEEFGLTHSRLPYLDAAIRVTRICFETFDRQLECPPFYELDHPHIITATYPLALSPGEKFSMQIEIVPLGSFQLTSDRGDFLGFTGDNPENLFGSHYNIPVVGTITAGQHFVFNNRDRIFTAPELPPNKDEMTFVSTWRVWMYTRYAGPEIRIVFTVKR